ncbi:hypothetical protein QTP88_019549 [Uroleucon formosanum]
MSKKFAFSSTEDEILISLVENNKVIFDSAHKKHKDNYFKDNIWKNISEEVGRSTKEKLPTGSAASYKKNRSTMNLSFLDTVEYERSTITNMDISGTHISNVSTSDDIRAEDVEENLQDNEEQDQTESTMSDLHSTSYYAGKRIRSKEEQISVFLAKQQNKLLATSMKTLCEEDDVDIFFKSIAMTVKKMSPQAIKEIDDKYSTPQTAQTLPYQVPPNYNYNNNMYQCQLSSPANSYSTSTSSQGVLPFNYDDTSNL